MLLDLSTAKAHLRVLESDEDTLITLYIGASEGAAVSYLNRKLYADSTALNAAIAAVPAALSAATATYEAAIVAADLLTNEVEQDAAYVAAETAYSLAQTTARETSDGLVVNDTIKAAMLLTIGDLFALREDTIVGVSVASMPMGARALLNPYRAGMGL